jgi:hypothetical protein
MKYRLLSLLIVALALAACLFAVRAEAGAPSTVDRWSGGSSSVHRPRPGVAVLGLIFHGLGFSRC